jgi:hypothetical protein
MRCTFFAAALLATAAIAGPAVAQESPELPANTGQPAPFFYKGKGPGRDNSYVERYEEDWSYLRDPTLSTDPWFDPLKYIPLDPSGDTYLTLNGEIRFRYDNTDHKSFAIAPSATPGVGGKGPSFTPATGVSSNQLYKQRYELGADLHLGDYVRFYGELYHGQQTGHDAGDPIPGMRTSPRAAPARRTARCRPISRCIRTRNTTPRTTSSRRPISTISRRGSASSRSRR